MIYLGLDLGEVTLGMAKSDSGIVAEALKTFRFPRNHYIKALDYLEIYLQEHKVDVVVLGLPKHMHDEIGEKAKTVMRFKSRLEKRTSAKIVLWDERLTTIQATKTLKAANLSSQKIKASKDSLAAVLILQNYLDYKGESND